MSANWRPSASRATLEARARLLTETRAFFAERGVLEVETPVSQQGPNRDHGVRPWTLDRGRWLVTSPEHHLKRLVAAGYGDVWTLTTCFRREEQGRRHSPEFSMLEWYRLDMDERELALETVSLLARLTGRDSKAQALSYRDIFRLYADIDLAEDSTEGLRLRASQLSGADFARASRRDCLDLILSLQIEPELGLGEWTIVTDYPADQAALARLRGSDRAARFEIYAEGLELANGYWECTDPGIVHERQAAAGMAPEDDEGDAHFAAAMQAGLPDCAGVAVGFDRVCMLALGETDIARVRAFTWDRS